MFFLITLIPGLPFKLVNSKGKNIVGEELGLLLYRNGTVCDDQFNFTVADAICRQMNYKQAIRWTSTESFEIQTNYDIVMDDIHCADAEWESCVWRTSIECDHIEDVFLSCSLGELNLKICKFSKYLMI